MAANARSNLNRPAFMPAGKSRAAGCLENVMESATLANNAMYEGRGDMTKQAEQVEAFEQVLLSHTEMCYSVALALTRNPVWAQDLTRNVLTWAWRLRGSPDAERDIKKKLLIALRKTFLRDYRQAPCGHGNEPMRGENTNFVAQEA